MRQREYLLDITVTVDADEVDTTEKMRDKQKEIRSAIENIDASIGIFEVQNIQEP